jgi:glycerol 2-dehydrogenase (NADP+)
LFGIPLQISSWQAIRECGIPREELFVTTKLTGTHHGCVKEAFEQSLSKLDIGYIDLYLVSTLPRSKRHSNPTRLRGVIQMHWPQALTEDGAYLVR